ncbi:translation initiation factor eIF-2B beta subunit [Cavenderia fasciculata]|uniref:Translation initiation factor eIF2B subunit beta n=1 Tax=Cavenderia fasciculata TaxID=261658 RepID=F4PIH5_CACFS|nr:translation initiation factor eIF-2B beta subunit [Cavenderia fasciculata]EGG25404.1 translation initiation factor eIF-2B beta subunit [Cavenderia fasciculata]|eukprot:XP_004363255.1 translation initiation factor eIF-2B beta subunit [Cavenderia fasciculata]
MEQPSHFLNQLETFILRLKRKRITGSFSVSLSTAEILRQYISTTKWSNAKHLIDNIKQMGKRLIETQPLEFCIGNIIRRVLFIIREEYLALRVEEEENPTIKLDSSRNNLLTYEEPMDDYSESFQGLKSSILDTMGEMIDELKGLYKSVAGQYKDHIHANEVIMTLGSSRTVEEFLKEAGKKRKFGVIVVETAPSLEGHQTALALSKCGIDTTLIPDSSIFAMMSRVNKVIIGTHAVMANGGLIAASGTHMLAVAAKYHSVPVMVCTGLYKLCPLYAYDQDTYNDFGSPAAYLKFKEAEFLEDVHSYNPNFDYIPPDLVSLFVTNSGGHNPSYIYRLLQEYYHPEDTFEEEKDD